ncbi:hypothetical protein L207DRAFT_585769 [Hyaloscypha variabilis F]|uniref:Uncharacterized protein n=1 Tax=Hyaloscypha variabilis (strain UAMH 11265 / GT02V1 / F) TaxID=1149755 RepID=A0A2J6RG05_HYAVF|nr:hypothetical protein L207DRAFT_585769 [Hyaloscypha variabilis F]
MLLEVLKLLKDLNDIKRLPKALESLKKSFVNQLPLLQQRKRKVDLVPEKVPTLAASAKVDGGNSPPFAWAYWFDPTCLISSILSTPSIKGQMFFGMAHFVDEPQEFYHSMSWASSIRLTSGEYAYYPDHTPIFPSDFVQYICQSPSCPCSKEATHRGRVYCVGKNYTSNAIEGEVTVLV